MYTPNLQQDLSYKCDGIKASMASGNVQVVNHSPYSADLIPGNLNVISNA